jgi:hypothetical protein
MSNMEKIVSPYGDMQPTIDVLNANPTIAKFAYEFCTEFDVRVQTRSDKAMKVFSTDGIKLGLLFTETHRSKSTNENETVYFFESNDIIKKGRGTSRSNSYTRDANKIKTLISNLKRNKEIPSSKAMHESFMNAIKYGFTSVGSARQPSVSISDALTIDLIEYALLDKPISTAHNEDIAHAYRDYQLEMKKFLSVTKEKNRFAQGARVIGVFQQQDVSNRSPYYLVGEADYLNTTVTIHGDLKRYESLKDEPEFSSDVLMIRTYMQSNDFFEDSNEFGLPRRDTYYHDIDIATGYASNEMWVLLPKTAP